jgi:hypothetical protein
MEIKRLAAAGAGAVGAFLVTAGLAFAAAIPFGGTSQGDNAMRLVSLTNNASAADDYSGVSFSVPGDTTLADMDELAAQYNVLGTDCGGGSPRFQVGVMTASGEKNINVYIGPEPNYTGCAKNTSVSSGNLLNGERKVDTSQLQGGTFYDTWEHAVDMWGTSTVTGVDLVVDGGWSMGGTQRVNVSRVDINGETYDLGNEENQEGDFIQRLRNLQTQFPQYSDEIEGWIDEIEDGGNGTTTPPTNPEGPAASIDNNGSTVSAGGHLDFVGRNFGRDEEVRLTLNGSTVRTVRADGGGNFSTGSMQAATTPGTYNYIFTGQTSGKTATSVITVE